MAVRSPDPTEALVAWEAGNSLPKIARDLTPLVVGAPYTLAGVHGALRKAVAATLGAELITNGGFNTGLGWTVGAGWNVVLGQAECNGQTGAAMSQSGLVITPGNRYLLGFDTVDASYGFQGLAVTLGGVADTNFFTQNRRNWVTLTAGAVSDALTFSSPILSSFVGAIDNVTLREVT